ncbi:hypothetical protein GGS23DRAFT_544298 [Durotheca rogersii]|uniref:uncharacterized protein n=1 Tax=Durotheca rogersii TaxID=419775 RepID=UPI00221F0E45|nr:uncharacterized protein GGS23DRAFT_544298 [Durotheca rogersii]KAI5868153.1 hypothetical protein GGS23DRAFT_544298 [Durotheca rogersii]
MSGSSIPTQVAETIQTAHIRRHPSAQHGVNPSTAASTNQPVRLRRRQHRRHGRHGSIDDTELASSSEDDLDGDSEALDQDDDDDIPLSVLRPRPRAPQHSFRPMPDLRFEQSYLHSIAKANSWWKVGWITVRDQMMMPFAQGVLYNLALCGWHHWNRHAQLSGGSAGARLRRWWYEVNNWTLPRASHASGGVKREVFVQRSW